MSFSNDDAIAARIVTAIRKTFPAARTLDVDETTTSLDVPGWDSLSYTFLIMNVENEFGIELPFESTAALANVGELVDLVKRLAA